MSSFTRRLASLFSAGAAFNAGTGRIDLTKSLPQRTVQEIAWAPTITPDPAGGEVVIVGQLQGNLTVNSIASPVAGQALELHFTQTSPARSVTFSNDYQQPVGTMTPAAAGARWMMRFRALGGAMTRKWYLESTTALDGRFVFYVNGWRGLVLAESPGTPMPRLVNHTNRSWVIDRVGIDASVAPSGGNAVVTYGFNGAADNGNFQLPSGSNNIWYDLTSTPLTMAPGSYIRAALTSVNAAQDVNFVISGRLG